MKVGEENTCLGLGVRRGLEPPGEEEPDYTNTGAGIQ